MTIRYNHINFLISIADLYNRKVCNQDADQSYIQAHNMGRDVYVMSDPLFGLLIDIILKRFEPL